MIMREEYVLLSDRIDVLEEIVKKVLKDSDERAAEPPLDPDAVREIVREPISNVIVHVTQAINQLNDYVLEKYESANKRVDHIKS